MEIRIASVLLMALFVGIFVSSFTFSAVNIDEMLDEADVDLTEGTEKQKTDATEPHALKRSLNFSVSSCTNVEVMKPEEQDWYVLGNLIGKSARNCVVVCTGKKYKTHTMVEIPEKGQYKIWVRYFVNIGEGGNRNPFEVSSSQKEKEVFRKRYYDFNIRKGGYGKDIEKEYNLSFDNDEIREGVVSGEQPVWEGFEAELDSGIAEITIGAVSTEKINYNLKLDTVFITKPLKYKPGLQDLVSLWVRLRASDIEPKDALLTGELWIQSHFGKGEGNWWEKSVPGILNEDGEEMGDGEFTRWFELTKYFDRGRRFYTTSFIFRSKPEIERMTAEVQFAWGPSEGKIFRSFTEDCDGNIFGIITPHNLVYSNDTICRGMRTSEYDGIFETVLDQAKKHYDNALKFGIEPDSPARKFVFCTNMGGYKSHFSSKKILDYEMSVLRIMGINMGGCGSPEYNAKYGIDGKKIFAGSAAEPRALIFDQIFVCPNDPIIDGKLKEYYDNYASVLKKKNPDISNQIELFKLVDEPGAVVDIAHIGDCAYCLKLFRNYLKENGVTPEQIGKKNLDTAKPIGFQDIEGHRSKYLYYWTMKFGCYNTAQYFARVTKTIESSFGRPQPTYANFSPHPFLFGNGMGMTDWFELERRGGTNLGWSEDWMKRGTWGFGGFQLVGYLVEIIRCAGAGKPYGMYIVGQCGDPGYKALTAVGHGAKKIYYFDYGPTYAVTENFFSDYPNIVEEIARANLAIKKTEDLLFPAKPRKVPVAFLYARTGDFWVKDRGINIERRCLYLALQHAQIPFDVIIEDDVSAGKLNEYKVLYILDNNIRKDAQERIKEWVGRGGILWACAGAGIKDEGDRKIGILNEVFGIERQEVYRTDPEHEFNLPSAQVLDTMTFSRSELFNERKIVCIGYKSKIKNKNGRLLATFNDGSPAVVYNEFGKGKSLLIGALPNLAYWREGAKEIIDRVRVGYRRSEREVSTKVFEMSGIKKPVEVSYDVVEAMSLECETGVSVVLVNYTMKKIDELEVRARDTGKAKKVFSALTGELTFRQEEDDVIFNLPVDKFDIVNIYR